MRLNVLSAMFVLSGLSGSFLAVSPALNSALAADAEKFRLHLRLEVEECHGDSHGDLNCVKTPFEPDSEILMTRIPGARGQAHLLQGKLERTELAAGHPWTAEVTLEHDLDAVERPYRVILRVDGQVREPGHLESRFTRPEDLGRLTWDSPTIRMPDGWAFVAARVDRPWESRSDNRPGRN